MKLADIRSLHFSLTGYSVLHYFSHLQFELCLYAIELSATSMRSSNEDSYSFVNTVCQNVLHSHAERLELRPGLDSGCVFDWRLHLLQLRRPLGPLCRGSRRSYWIWPLLLFPVLIFPIQCGGRKTDEHILAPITSHFKAGRWKTDNIWNHFSGNG